jgi:hypothetical protein
MSTFGRALVLVGLWAGLAVGQIPAQKPSDPVFVYDNNGRPLSGATVTVTDINGGDVEIYGNKAGTLAYSYSTPASGLVQFYGEAGYYHVTAAKSGVTRVWDSTIRDAVSGEEADTVDDVFINFNADQISFGLSDDPPLVCSNARGCYLSMFSISDDPIFEIRLVMPPFALNMEVLRVRYSFGALSPATRAVFRIEWCQYGENQQPCTPSVSQQFIALLTPSTTNTRYLDITQADYNMNWDVNKTVRMWFARLHSDPQDTASSQDIRIEGVSYEFSR